MERQHGKIKKWFADRHFGFVTLNDTNQDVYFSESVLPDPDIYEGMPVIVTVEEGYRGPRVASMDLGL